MTRLFVLVFTALITTLTGCGGESTEYAVDGRDVGSVSNNLPGRYEGTVIDGYLVSARVWLDVDGDLQYTPGPLDVELASGTTVTLLNGEPTALTGVGGRFSLDTSEFLRDPLESADLNPTDYPLVAVAIPGLTEEETRSGNVLLSHAYAMSAPPGVRYVTPLTTLSDIGLNQSAFLFGAGAMFSQILNNINVHGDYVLAGDARAHAYARALVRFMMTQFPDFASEAIRDGTERVLSREAINIMRLSYVSNAAAVIAVVDDAAAGVGYGNVDVASLILPDVPLDLEDPKVLRKQSIKAFSEDGLPTSSSRLTLSAALNFEYNPAGQLLEIEVDGCVVPSLQEIARLANADGRISATDTQALPAVSLSPVSLSFYDEAGVDERLSFDWRARRAEFETRTSCQSGLADASELGGEPERIYSWQMVDGRVASITDGEHTLVPNYTHSTDTFFGYTLSDTEGQIEAVALTDSIVACLEATPDEDLLKSRIIAGQQSFTFSGYAPQPIGFDGLMLDWDVRDGNQQLLRRPLLDPAIDQDGQGLEWEFVYGASPNDIAEGQPNLVSNATLSRYSGTAPCGYDATRISQSEVYAVVDYSYSTLSRYLADQLK
ncbi:hypothetical protein [Marinobacter caseinilyticus]|uniref:hypothetical protein n=1 Tax=Marinobacter caseinilyticus TaxID=2692195 RepID=UPI0014080C89|nr:hypothetical protein [Marinobacter caseinilyticus]